MQGFGLKHNAVGAGLGFRRELLPQLKRASALDIDFFELAPENWIGVGGKHRRDLRLFTEQFPFCCHGLSLSIGSAAPLDTQLLKSIKSFMVEHNIQLYTEHLSWCSDASGQLYDLLPIPCTEDAVKWVAERIKQAQDILGQQIGFENASYYFSPPEAEMKEEEFIAAVIDEADCLLHLDVNNIYVNSQNFGFDAETYLASLPLEKVCYIHVAGHFTEPDGFIVDTHGAEVIDPVWSLLQSAYQKIGPKAKQIPTLLERDFNFPSLDSLLHEVNIIRTYQNAISEVRHAEAG